jgi:hypothetical protein
MPRTQASFVHKHTKNLRAVQRLLEHRNIQSTACFLGIEVDGTLDMAEQTEVQVRSRKRARSQLPRRALTSGKPTRRPD